MAAVAAAGLVAAAPTTAGLMYPNPPVVCPVGPLVCVAKAFVLDGTLYPARLKILRNSARIVILARSLMRKVRARLALSCGRRCIR